MDTGAVLASIAGKTLGQPIRLDIGSGHKVEEGWLSVDQPIGAREKLDAKGRRRAFLVDPDIPCDIRAIPLPDDYADEVRAIHVIEHFYPWEAPEILREWVRVLKPGGPIALECPCLDKVLMLAQVPQVPPDFTFWALYGDPRWKEPAMMHKWAYTQLQLRKVMEEAGLVNVENRMPKFHHPIRDMRLVARKPESTVQLVDAMGNPR